MAVAGQAGAPVPVTTEPISQGASLFGLFHHAPDQTGKTGPLLAGPVEVRRVTNPEGAGFTIAAPFQAKAAGAPVFDRFGALVGMAERNDRILPAIAGTLPVADYRVTGALAIRPLLDRAGVSSAVPGTAGDLGIGDLISVVRPSVALVSCVDGDTAAP